MRLTTVVLLSCVGLALSQFAPAIETPSLDVEDPYSMMMMKMGGGGGGGGGGMMMPKMMKPKGGKMGGGKMGGGGGSMGGGGGSMGGGGKMGGGDMGKMGGKMGKMGKMGKPKAESSSTGVHVAPAAPAPAQSGPAVVHASTSCKSGAGVCQDISKSSCSGGHYESGFCPGASNIKCCISDSTPTPPPSSSGGDLTLNQLIAVMPGVSSSKASQYLPYLNSAMRSGGITTRRRQCAFLAQVGHESGSLRYMEEIASGAAYEGRRDLGNTQPGDGVRYKGRGPIQITGRANYQAAGQALGLDLINNPTQAATPQVGFRLAVWFWNSRGLNSYADQGTQSAFDTITRRINGGTNGKSDRDSRWALCKRTLGA